MRERRERGDGGHHDEDRAPFLGAGCPRDPGADALGEAGFGQRGGDDEHRGDDDGGLAGEAGQGFAWGQDPGRRQREQRQHRGDVDANLLADEEDQRDGDDREEYELLWGHGLGPAIVIEWPA